MQHQSHNLVLASSSPYRRMLLQRLGLGFEVCLPGIDETPLGGESPETHVARLASAKAEAVARRFPACTVIGSDQVAVSNSDIVGKPGSAERAVEQLLSFSGHCIRFLTAVSIRCEEKGFAFDRTVPTDVRFRRFTEAEARRYVEIDNPVDCAGSFKSESLGICLLESIRSDDPTAIIGLPLIAVSDALRKAGMQVP